MRNYIWLMTVTVLRVYRLNFKPQIEDGRFNSVFTASTHSAAFCDGVHRWHMVHSAACVPAGHVKVVQCSFFSSGSFLTGRDACDSLYIAALSIKITRRHISALSWDLSPGQVRASLSSLHQLFHFMLPSTLLLLHRVQSSWSITFINVLIGFVCDRCFYQSSLGLQ